MTTIKFRRDTSANWTSVNPIPAQGEPCYETDTGKLKIGNGSDNYVALPYVSDGGGSSGELPIATATTLGGIKVGNNLSITEDGTLSANAGSAGTTDYAQLENKPQINSVELTGNKTLNDLGIQPKGDYQPAGDYADAVHTHTIADVTNLQTTLDGKQAVITSTNKLSADLIKDGTTNKVVTATEKNTWNGKQDAIADLATIRSGASKGTTSIQPNDNISKLTNDAGYLTEAPIPTNMVTTDTDQTISGSKTFTKSITTTDIFPAGEITFTQNSQYRYINYIDTIGGGYHAQNGYITLKGDTTLVGDNKLILDGRTGGLKLTAASSANITCENDLIAPNIRTTANGTIKLTHPTNVASGLITLDNNYGQLSISSSSEGNNNLLGVTRGTTYALINGDNITTKDKDGNLHYYINSQNIDTTYLKWDTGTGKLTIDTTAITPVRYPVEISDKSLMPSWYVVYNDGWCEQGGTIILNSNGVTVTFLKPFSDAKYNIQISQTSTGSKNMQYYGNGKIDKKNASNFIGYTGQSENPYFDWSACGYIA